MIITPDRNVSIYELDLRESMICLSGPVEWPLHRFFPLGVLRCHCVRKRIRSVYQCMSLLKRETNLFVLCFCSVFLSFYVLMMVFPDMRSCMNMVPIDVIFRLSKFSRKVLKHPVLLLVLHILRFL